MYVIRFSGHPLLHEGVVCQKLNCALRDRRGDPEEPNSTLPRSTPTIFGKNTSNATAYTLLYMNSPCGMLVKIGNDLDICRGDNENFPPLSEFGERPIHEKRWKYRGLKTHSQPTQQYQ